MRVMLELKAAEPVGGGLGVYTLDYEPARVVDISSLADVGLELDKDFAPVLAPRAPEAASMMQLATFSARPQFELEDLAPPLREGTRGPARKARGDRGLR
jgi:hypothetical protein